jgi:hypothetical protein
VEHCVGFARNDEDANNCEAAVLGRVYEVCLHCELLAIDEMFARMMEVKLCQPIPALSYMERVACCETKLDGVSIVDDGIGPLGPTDLERRLTGANSASDVDWGLLVTNRARGVLCFETAPLVWPGRTLIAPVVSFLGKPN